ncbi:MAG: phosphoglycerate dehydrogenase [Planctomycetota bacterium]
MTPTSFPKSEIKVVLLEGIHEAAAEAFRAEGFDVRTHKGAMSTPELLEAAGDAHLVGIRSKTRLEPEFFAGASRLLGVGCFCIGTNQVALASSRDACVPVFNAPFSNTRSVAELTIAELVVLSRKVGDRSREMHEGVWQKSAAGSHEIRGMTLGIVGYGHIGSQVSVLAEAMGLRVVFFDVVPKLALGNAVALGSLEELLEVSDAVTLHVPATAATKDLIGAAELARMKPGAMLINNSRGSVVDVRALALAIGEGRLGGAAVDVFPEEPKLSGEGFESALRGLPNVFLTPHIGGSTEEAQANIGRDVSSKLLKFVNNGSTTGAVNVPEVDLPGQRSVDGTRSHRILHFHKNEPGVLAAIHGTISEAGVNVLGEYLQTDRELGYVVLDVDPSHGREALERLGQIAQTVRTRELW